jgi:geranylgeranyl pyrophosphate synthase
MGEVERRLAELAGGHGSALAADAGGTLEAGGKRLRPILVLLCAGP